MRLLTRLSAQADAAYQNAYHHKLRGAIWQALEDTAYDESHEDGQPPGLSFSNVFPWGDLAEGDQRNLLVASPHEELLAEIADHFKTDRELNIGEMPFRVESMSVVDPDVGEPGTSGILETATGVVVRLNDPHRQEYGIKGDYGETVTHWRPDHSMAPFTDAIEDNAQLKHDLFAPDHLPGPTETDGGLFDGYELIKTYALPVEVTTGEVRDMVVSKWRFDYTVRDDDHRRHLNLLLDCGVGGRNALGFGFVNRVDDAAG